MYRMNVVYSDGHVGYIVSENIVFLCELGEDGLKYGNYLSAEIEEIF